MWPPRVPHLLLVGLFYSWALLYPKAMVFDANSIDPQVTDIINVWTAVSTGPPFLQDHSLVGLNNKLVAFGGWVASSPDGTQFISGDMYTFDIFGETWSQTIASSWAGAFPGNRHSHSAVMHNGMMYILGGENETSTLGDLWVYNFTNNTWSQMDPSSWDAGSFPQAVKGHCAVVVDDLMYIFGGMGSSDNPFFQYSNLLYTYNFSANTWTRAILPNAPPARAHHSCVSYYNDSKVVPGPYDTLCTPEPCLMVFGGEGRSVVGAMSDLWLFSIANMRWYQAEYLTSWRRLQNLDGALDRIASSVDVTGRIQHQCIMVLQRMLCVGGYEFPGYADLAEYDPIFNRWLRPNFANELPFGLAGHRMLLLDETIYVHGGIQATTRTYSSPTLASSNYQRPLCRPGWAAPDGNWMCFPCPTGYAAFAGSYTCDLCPAGTYASPTADDCIQCSAGYFQPLSGQSSFIACLQCPRGTYSPLPGGTSPNCTRCPAGRYEDRWASTSCRYCPAGTYRTVPVGSTALAINSSSCLACPAGTYSLVGAETCIPCPAGYFSPYSGQPYCSSCPLGSWSLAGRSGCTQCPAGTFATSFGTAAQSSAACQLCPPGSYSSGGQSSCTPCAKGEYQPQYGSTSCLPCDTGTFGNVTGMAFKACYPCPAGTYNPLTRQSTCQKCPIATFSTEVGAVSSSVCTPCPDGTYSPNAANSDPSGCTPCPPGYWGQPIIAGKGLSACFQCEPGTYQPLEGASSRGQCLPCPPMTFSNAGASACQPCRADQYAHGGWRECVRCNETQGQSEGWVANGHFNLFWISSNLTDTDKWARQAGSQLCERSNVSDVLNNTRIKTQSEYTGYTGKFTPGFLRYVIRTDGALFNYAQTATLNVFNLPIIRVSAWSRAAFLSAFPGRQGQYQLRATFTMARNVTSVQFNFTPPVNDPGSNAWMYGAILFQPTSPLQTVKVELVVNNFLKGGFVDWDDVSIVPYEADVCQCLAIPGTYFSRTEIDAITESHCIWCLPSYACRAGIQFKCSANEMSHGQSPSCMPCLPGWLCTYQGASPCPYLTYVNLGKGICERCTPGYQCGELQLLPCWPGTYGHGGYECIQCLPGTFSNMSGAQFCYNCPPGTTSNYMRTECTTCPPNYYSPYGRECLLCPPGSYTASAGATSCQSCSNITEDVYITIFRNTFVQHINIVPDFCAGQVDFTILAVQGVALGNVTFHDTDGRSVTYFANAGAVGIDDIAITVTDSISNLNQSILLYVTIVNRLPEGRADFLSVTVAQSSGTIAPLVNDFDADKDELFIHSIGWDGANNGITVTVNADKTVTVTFPSSFVGNARNLYYYVNDSIARTTTPTLIALCRACSVPVAQDDSVTLSQGTTVSVNVLANDYDADGDNLTITAVTVSKQGAQPVINGTSVIYIPPQRFCGRDEFSYTVSTSDGSDVGRVAATIVNCQCMHTLDILLLLDGSNGVTDNGFLLQLQFAALVQSRVVMSDQYVRLGVLQYSTSPEVEIAITGTSATFTTGLKGIAYQAGASSDIGFALNEAVSQFSSNFRGSGFFRRIVLISSGAIKDASGAIVMAANLKQGGLPIRIYTIAVGQQADTSVLSHIAYQATDAYARVVLDFYYLNGIVPALVDSMCDMNELS